MEALTSFTLTDVEKRANVSIQEKENSMSKCKHDSTYADQPYAHSQKYAVMCGGCGEKLTDAIFHDKVSAEAGETAYHAGRSSVDKPDQDKFAKGDRVKVDQAVYGVAKGTMGTVVDVLEVSDTSSSITVKLDDRSIAYLPHWSLDKIPSDGVDKPVQPGKDVKHTLDPVDGMCCKSEYCKYDYLDNGVSKCQCCGGRTGKTDITNSTNHKNLDDALDNGYLCKCGTYHGQHDVGPYVCKNVVRVGDTVRPLGYPSVEPGVVTSVVDSKASVDYGSRIVLEDYSKLVRVANRQATLPLAVNNQTEKGNEVSNKTTKPVECENGCPENQTCDYCAATCCKKDVEASEESSVGSFDFFLLLSRDIDNNIVVADGATTWGLLNQDFEDPHGEWIVKVKLPMSAIEATEPNKIIPVVDLT